MLHPRNSFSFKNTSRVMVKERVKINQSNSNKNKTGLAMLLSDKIDCKLKRSKETEKAII